MKNRCVGCGDEARITINGVRKKYKICDKCLNNLYPKIKITGTTARSTKIMTNRERKKRLQEEVDTKLNDYLGGI